MKKIFDGFEAGLICALGVIAGFTITAILSDVNSKEEAIRHHAAHYDSQTGDFKWND